MRKVLLLLTLLTLHATLVASFPPDPSGILAEIQTTFDQRYQSMLVDSIYAVITSVYAEHSIPIVLEMDGNDTFLVNHTILFRVGLTISTR